MEEIQTCGFSKEDIIALDSACALNVVYTPGVDTNDCLIRILTVKGTGENMVVPFGLDPEHQPLTVNNTASGARAGVDSGPGAGRNMMTPSAPPSFLMSGYGQVNVQTGVPIIPSPYIEFIVVNGDERSMIRCQRKAVMENSVELGKIIKAGPNSGRRGDNHFQISNVDKTDFEMVIRFLERNFVGCRDHTHILKILELAARYDCPSLILHCIRELDLSLTTNSVIEIFGQLWFYQNLAAHITNPHQFSNSVTMPPATNVPQVSCLAANNANGAAHDDARIALLHNVLQLIDMKATMVLTMPELTNLRFEQLEMIAKRDALQLSSEMVLFTCLADWSVAECKRRLYDCTDAHRRQVLGPLCYAPRYLLMTMPEFRRACDRVELLDPMEISLISDAIEGKKLKNLTAEQSQMLEKFRTARPEFAKMPVYLSDRSNPKNYPKKMRRAEKCDNEDSCWLKSYDEDSDSEECSQIEKQETEIEHSQSEDLP